MDDLFELRPNELYAKTMISAEEYMKSAMIIVDKHFGEKASERFPEIVASVMTVHAMDYNAAFISKTLSDSLEKIVSELRVQRNEP